MVSLVTPSSFKRLFVGDDDSYAGVVPADDLLHVAGPYGPILRVGSTPEADYVYITQHGYADVRAFGAKGDGTTDDTVAIQAAANAINAAGGGTLFFPFGTYNRTGPVTIYSNTTVRGGGNARITCVGAQVAGDTVFINPNLTTYNANPPQTSSALQTDENYLFDGLILERVCLLQFLFAKNLTVMNCQGAYTEIARGNLVQIRGCDNVLIQNNIITSGGSPIDFWQGCTRVKILHNIIELFENLTASGNKYGIGINALGSNATTNLRNVAQTVDDVLIEGNSIETNGTAGGIQFDPLASGCSVRNLRIINNRITASSGVNNYGIYARGDIRDFHIQGNHLAGCDGSPLGAIHVGGFFDAVSTATDTISTAIGSASVVIVYPNNGVCVGGWVRVRASGGGPTSAVGGLTLNGYYPVTAVSAGAFASPTATVTITASGTAAAAATGGGLVEIVGYHGNPVRGIIADNVLVNCANASGPLIFAGGTSITIRDNDMTLCGAANYGSLTFTDQTDRDVSATQWASVVVGNTGAPGTGYSGTSNSTRDSYTGLPLIMEPRTEAATPSWWVKGPVTFADLVTLSGQATAWTPVMEFGGGSTGMVYVQQNGVYTRVGNMLFFSAKIQISAKGSSTGNATVRGLPVAISGQNHSLITVTYAAGITSASSDLYLAYINSTTFLLQTALIGGATLTHADFGASSYIYFSGWYFTA